MLNFQKNDYSAYAMEAGLAGGSLGSGGGFGGLDEKVVRQGFVRKVFGILSAQMVFTVAVCAFFMSASGVETFMKSNPWVLLTSMGGTFGVMIAMICNQQLLRQYPANYMLLGAFTFFESIMIGTVCMLSNKEAVLLAASITAVITLSLTAYAMQTKYDFTASGGLLVGALVALLIVSFARLFFPRWHALELLLAGGGALLFACFLVVDIQMLMDGNRIQLDPDDYVLGALQLYLDIINLFLYILRIINEMQRN